jgi:hypothetical protein
MMEIIDCAQNDADWHQHRSGLITASQFKTVMANGKGGTESKTRSGYMRRLAAEIITGEPLESFTSQAMARGHVMEDEARRYYAFLHDIEPQQVGFIRNGRKGCSPDSLLGNDGLLEIKSQRGDLLIETLMKDQFPPEHVAQVQGQLWITEREHCDIMVFWPGMPTFVKRAGRDEVYIAKLSDAVDRFTDELDELVEKIRRYGSPTEAQPVSGEAA